MICGHQPCVTGNRWLRVSRVPIDIVGDVADLVRVEEIEAAAERLRGLVVRTPLVPFRGRFGSGVELSVKPESLQPIGAFKLRGAFAAMTALSEAERAPGVVAHSSGNHAQAVAYAARELGISAALVIPHTAPLIKVEACRALGAEVVLVEPTLEARLSVTDRLAEAHGFAIIPPFDDPRIIAGQGTIGLEILADQPETDVVLVPVGGGGLISGIAAAIKGSRPEVHIVGVEPERVADARDSLRSGVRTTWPAERFGPTIADALTVQPVGELPFAHMREYVENIVTVSEEELRSAMRVLARTTRLIAEPGGAAATAAFLYHQKELPEGRRYVAILSGGNVDPGLLNEVLNER